MVGASNTINAKLLLLQIVHVNMKSVLYAHMKYFLLEQSSTSLHLPSITTCPAGQKHPSTQPPMQPVFTV